MRKVDGDAKMIATLQSRRVEDAADQAARLVATAPAVGGGELELAPETESEAIQEEELDEEWLMAANDEEWEEEDDFDDFDDDEEDDEYVDEEDDLEDDDYDDDDDEDFEFDEDED